MKKSIRSQRMERKHRRKHGEATISLTALMDVFTVLVFMLLVNSSDGIQINDTKVLKMPMSSANEMPKEGMLIQISQNDVLVGGQKFADLTDKNKDGGINLTGVKDELKYQAERSPEMTEEEKEFGRAVTIQADRKLAYDVLRQIMATCAVTDYRNISLAVTHKMKGH